MNKIIYSFDELKNMKELDFYKNEGLMVNVVTIVGVDKINVVLRGHDMISLQFMRNEEKVAAILVTKRTILEVNNKNIIQLKSLSENRN